MRFLIDENLSPLLAHHLVEAGHQAAPVRQVGMVREDDLAILTEARRNSQILVTADTEFGGLLAQSGDVLPSVILMRRLQGRRAVEQSDHLLAHLHDVQQGLEAGSIVAFDEGRLRVRTLPI
ncbi:MAG: DUF5615 family PIN-like protein [Egibacteraceae bacterium]